jgi:hypothetical protein
MYDTSNMNDTVGPVRANRQTNGAFPPDEMLYTASSNTTHPNRPGSESRLNERLASLVRQRKGADALMLGVLSIALLFGLIGFAAHAMWIVAVIVLALGLGFIIADTRRNRIDVANQRSEKAGPGPQ